MNTNAFFTDPAKLAETTREATLSTIDGALQLHAEMQKATLQAWEQARAEGVRLVDAQSKALQDTMNVQREATEKSLGWLREQVERVAAPTTSAKPAAKTSSKGASKA